MNIAEQLNMMTEQTGGASGLPASGLTLAKVTNVTDEENMNRVKCLPLGEKNEDEETEWCYVMTPLGGKEYGTFFFPQVDDLVVLAYLNGDIHNPVVLGSMWTPEITPPYTIQDGKVMDYSIKTPKKTELLFHDEDEKFKASLTMPSEAAFTMDDENKTITLQDKEGKNSLSINWDKSEIEWKADEKLTITVGEASITMEKSGAITIKGSKDITIDSGANLVLKGAPKLSAQATSVEIKADSQMNIQGATTTVKADAQMNIEGAQTAVKGNATLDLNASGPASLKGAIVKIN